MKKLQFFAVIAIAILFSTSWTMAADVKIGAVNIQRVLNESQAGKDAVQELETEVKKRQEQVDAKQEELKKLSEEIEKKKSVWSQEMKGQKEKEFQARMQEFQKFFVQSNDEVKRKEQEKKTVIIKDVLEIVKKLAKENGYTFVFEAQAGIIYSPPEADLTDEVIKRYNAEYKKKEKK